MAKHIVSHCKFLKFATALDENIIHPTKENVQQIHNGEDVPIKVTHKREKHYMWVL